METTSIENQKFISKLTIDNYELGSFDVYLDTTKQMLRNLGYSEEEIEFKISSMPYNYRASVIRKASDSSKTDEYIGYIGISNYDSLKGEVCLEVELENLNEKDYNLILETYLDYLKSSLNIKTILNITDYYQDKEELKPKNQKSIVIPRKFVRDEPEEKDLLEVKSWGFSPKLSYMRSVYINNKFIGIIGLVNVSSANRRATLSYYLNPSLGSDLLYQFGEVVIDEYLDYLHEINFYNIEARASKASLDDEIIKLSKMKKFGELPLSDKLEGNLVSRNLYQSIPSKDLVEVYTNSYAKIAIPKEEVSKEFENILELTDSNYQLIRPTVAEKMGLDFNHLVDGHILALKDRERFTIPLGEDKYFLQRGNAKYGIYKSVLNMTYLLVSSSGDYAGYINILREEDRHVDIELGVTPGLQGFGLGRKMLEAFYEELFRLGYVTITSQVFDFNDSSIRLHEKVASFNGLRISSYYANGILHDMRYYTKVKTNIDLDAKSK